MAISSHRLKIEEKKVYRKLAFSLFFFLFFILLIIFAGIPFLTKTIVFLTSFRRENISVNVSDATIVNPPLIDPILEATNSGTITISGTIDKDSTVRISVNDVEQAKVSADKDGKFIAKNIKLSEGNNTIVATTFIGAKESKPSTASTIVYKKNPPKLDISAPSEGQKFMAEAKDITISGETDPATKLTINDRLVIVSPDGKFNYKVTLSDGDNKFNIVATDIAGNQTIVERKVSYNP